MDYMDYNEGLTYVKSLIGKEGQVLPHPGLIIDYPGIFKPGDYKLSIERFTPKHQDIAWHLYKLIINNTYDFEQLNDLLIDVYRNGTKTIYGDPVLEDIKHLIYWVTLQEEVNHSRSTRQSGINLPLCRYFEAIYSTNEDCEFSFKDVAVRCEERNGRPPLYDIENAPCYYHI